MTRPQPNDHLAGWRDDIARSVDSALSDQLARATPTRRLSRWWLVALVVAVVVVVAWLVTS